WVETYKKSMLTPIVLALIADHQPIGIAAVAEALRSATGWNVTERGLYRTLKRLEDSQLLATSQVDAPRTGAKRKELSLTDVRAVHERSAQFGLLLLQRQNLLLDRMLGDEAIDHDAACLSDPMRAVDRLGLGRRVPPRVEQKHIVGLGEGETEAAGLEADEEHGSAAGAEGLDDLRPVPRRPV